MSVPQASLPAGARDLRLLQQRKESLEGHASSQFPQQHCMADIPRLTVRRVPLWFCCDWATRVSGCPGSWPALALLLPN